MSYRLRNIGIAVALAVLAALLTIFYVTNYKRSVQSGEELVPVYVAAADIPVGTSGDEVGDRNLMKVVEIANRTIVPGSISEPEQIQQKVATERIYQGEQITLNRFKPLGEQGIQAQIKGRLRAMQVPGSEHQLLLGTLETGNRVDFVGTVEQENGNNLTKVVLRDLLVLKAPSSGGVESKLTARPDQAYAVILAVSDAQSQKMFHIMEHGKWSLSLRPVTDPADSRNTVDTTASVMGTARSRRAR
jgi:Flp pilus assembly protein CpaB